MAMNLGIKTKKLYLGFTQIVTDNYEQYVFGTDGRLDPAVYNANKKVFVDQIGEEIENTFIDLGIVTDEREELAVGSIPIPIPGGGAQHRLNWPIGGKVLRVSLSGIIPDGVYVSKYTGGSVLSPLLDGKSNASVFRYKMNRLITYQNVVDQIPGGSLGSRNYMPNIVQYRRTYLKENNISDIDTTNLVKYFIASYSSDFINGTRNIRYSITLEMTNNTNLFLGPGIKPRDLGDI